MDFSLELSLGATPGSAAVGGGGACSLLDMAGDGAFGRRVGAAPGAIHFLVEGLPWFDQSFVRGLFIGAVFRRNSWECRSGGGACSLLDMAGDGAFGHRIGAEPGAIHFLVEGLPKVTLVRSILRAWSFH